MSLIEKNSTEVKTGSEFLTGFTSYGTNSTYLSNINEYFDNRAVGAAAATVAFFAFGFIFAPIQIAIQHADGTRTYDQLVAKFAAKAKEVQYKLIGADKNGADAQAATILKAEIATIRTELRGRVERVLVDQDEDTKTAIMQAAQFKIEQAYVKVAGGEEGEDADADIKEQAAEYSQNFRNSFVEKSVRGHANNIVSSISHTTDVLKAVEKNVKALTSDGIFAGNKADAEAAERKENGIALARKFPDTVAGNKAFATIIKDLQPSQFNRKVNAEVDKAVQTLKDLVADKKKAVLALSKNETAAETAGNAFDEIKGQLGQKGNIYNGGKSDGLYAELAAFKKVLTTETNKKADDQDKKVITQAKKDISEKEAEIKVLEPKFTKAEEVLNKLVEENEGLTAARGNAQQALEEHLGKFFNLNNGRGYTLDLNGKSVVVKQETLDKVAHAGDLEAAEELSEDGKTVTTAAKYVELPASNADLKNLVVRKSIEKQVRKDLDAAKTYKVEAREEGLEALKPVAKKNKALDDTAEMKKAITSLAKQMSKLAKNNNRNDISSSSSEDSDNEDNANPLVGQVNTVLKKIPQNMLPGIASADDAEDHITAANVLEYVTAQLNKKNVQFEANELADIANPLINRFIQNLRDEA